MEETPSMPKETEARTAKKLFSLNKEQRCLTYLSECWWSTLRHIFKAKKEMIIKMVVNYISFGGKVPSMVFVLKSDGHTWFLHEV